MREFFSVAEILAAGSPALPADKGGMARLIEERGWRADPRHARLKPGAGRGGGAWEYHVNLLPAEARARLLAAEAVLAAPSRETAASALWERFNRLPAKAKGEAEARLKAVDQVNLLSHGMARQVAVSLVAREAEISASTLWNWLRSAEEVGRSDRLPALAPKHQGRTSTSACDPRAWDFLVADYLRPEQPSVAACHRRMVDAAQAHGWSPIPAAKTLQRRLEKTIPRGVSVLARKGAQAVLAVYPHQTRDRGVFHALEAVNADGHRFDVFCRWPGEEKPARPIMVAIQDLYSGMILAHRIDRTENWSVVRLAFADLVESFGIPEHCWLDNGRSFASKWLSGGTKTRFRFSVRDDEPAGILTQLGVQIHWATPYHGQAKPIERAFRDLCEEIAKHPACAGAYTGNRPDAKPDNYQSKALPIADFEALVAAEIARHNSRPGRRAATAAGRSLAETFRASFEALPVRRAHPEQRRMLLMAAEAVRSRKPTGEVQLAGNRYWADALADHAGSKLVLRFDPQDFLRPVAVYTLDGRFICDAPVIEAAGFADADAARRHAQARRDWIRSQREMLSAERRLTIDQVAALLPSPAPAERPEPSIVKLVVNGAPVAEPQAAGEVWAGAASFSRGLERLYGENILHFPASDPSTGAGKEEGGRG